jgi:hypothetical protein
MIGSLPTPDWQGMCVFTGFLLKPKHKGRKTSFSNIKSTFLQAFGGSICSSIEGLF